MQEPQKQHGNGTPVAPVQHEMLRERLQMKWTADDTTIGLGVHVATMHLPDAPIGRAAKFHVCKLFEGLPCCHRSWANPGRGFFLHGYERSFEVEFACTDVEPGTGFVVDFRTIKDVRSALHRQFDHTTLIAADDPHRDAFEMLADRGVIDLRIMDNTSMESSAAWAFETAERIVAEATSGRVWVSRVEARESRNHAVTLTTGD
jgi:6-pyruvoyl-tetrahydropterin synthase